MSVSIATNLRRHLLVSASLLSILSAPALAQTAPQTPPTDDGAALDTIVVTAQRQSQSLQDVPIAVSAFGAEQLEKSGIEGASDIQFATPNVTFTKTNFTSQSFQIRGVGANAVGAATEGSTGIHINDIPVRDARIFETEFFDVERVEILRGPQGTQFGRNATGGVLNVLTKRPTSEFESNFGIEYSNYESLKLSGAINIPLGDTAGFRFAGNYLNRDGYTKNLFTGNNIDGRDQFALRGSFRWDLGENTSMDIMVQHFQENSDRSRTGKQLCNRDVTGVYGCLPDRLNLQTLNGNATLANIVSSPQFFGAAFSAVQGALGLTSTQFGQLVGGLGLANLAGADQFAGVVNPTDLRTVNVDYEPTYKSNETLYQLTLKHEFEKVNLRFNAGYASAGVNSTTDYNIAAPNPVTVPALINNPAAVTGIAPQLAILIPGLTQLKNRLFQGNNIGVSAVNANGRDTYTGFISGDVLRYSNRTTDYDRSVGKSYEYSFEAVATTQFDGPLNVLLGANYSKGVSDFVDYYVVSSGLDYASGILGLFQGLGNPSGPLASAAPYFNSETQKYRITSKAGFGEIYYEPTDELKLTVGMRYLQDKKYVSARSPLYAALVPYGAPSAIAALNTVDTLPNTPAIDPFQIREASFKRVTGRAVIDWKPELSFTDDTLIYASYSRGFKSGGINPPFNPVIFPNAAVTFGPETINAYEIGTKNRFADGKMQLNLTGFYYDYKDLQISSIVARSSFNDNVDAKIWGIELETQFKPTPELLFSANASYLKTKIGEKSILDPSNVTGGRSDVLLLKDITNASQCVAVPNTPGGNVRTALQTVGATLTGAGNATNNAGLRTLGGIATSTGAGAFAVPGTNHFGNFGICSALGNTASGAAGVFQAVTGQSAGFTIQDGILTNLKGNELQNSPRYKFAAAIDYTYPLSNEMSVAARIDYSWQAKAWGSIYNRGSDAQIGGGACTTGGTTVICGDRMPAFSLVNAQIRLIGEDSKWTVRGFVQNIFNEDAITGLYTTDQSSGLFRNAFLVEPRRYGIAAEVRF
jgi:iron complex outermembrane recepter protein